MLIVFGGLPGVGKTTLARMIAREWQALYLRIDTIEGALRKTDSSAVGSQGYDVAYALALENLTLGCAVVADSVNPLTITRDAWRHVAQSASSKIIEVEIVCSDRAEHRERIETRALDSKLGPPLTWKNVVDRRYEVYDRERIVIDTRSSISETFEELRSKIKNAS